MLDNPREPDLIEHTFLEMRAQEGTNFAYSPKSALLDKAEQLASNLDDDEDGAAEPNGELLVMGDGLVILFVAVDEWWRTIFLTPYPRSTSARALGNTPPMRSPFLRQSTAPQ